MPAEDLDSETVTSMYEASHELHERRWEQEGHRSYHHGYYDEDVDEAGVAAERMIEVVAEAVGVTGGDRVLNLGCGVGEDAVWVARHCGASVVGVNVHERQLDLAREYAEEAGVDDRVTFRYDDFHELETVANDSVDVVWGLEALCHSSDTDRVVEVARRVLGDGGRLVFADLFRRRELSDAEADRLRKLYDSWDVRYGPIDELERTLTDHGFRRVESRDVSDAVVPSVEHDYRTSLYGYPYYRIMSALGRADDRLVGLSIGGYHCYKLFQSGALGYYVVTAESSAADGEAPNEASRRE